MDEEQEVKQSKHKYSTIVLIIIIGVVSLTALAAGIDGFGTKGYISKFLYGDVIGNASIWDNGTVVNVETELTVNGSRVCTEDNNVCVSQTTLNGTIYDATRSFELVKFCSAASFSSNVDPNLLNCSVGNITDLSFFNGSWSCMSCAWDATKCSTIEVSNITSYLGLNLTSEHRLSSEFNGGFYVMCCNPSGAMCYSQLVSSVTYNGSVCSAGYNELIGSATFNNVSNNWSVTSCLNGFK